MPDFVSGFMGAMTGHEFTPDYEACYTPQDSGMGPLPTIEKAVPMAIGMMRKDTFFGDLVAAPLFLYFMAEMPNSLISCAQIPTITKDEVHVLTSLKGLIKPTVLGRNMTITYLQKGDEIKSEKKTIPDSWDSADYVQSGRSLGNLLTMLLGLEKPEI